MDCIKWAEAQDYWIDNGAGGCHAVSAQEKPTCNGVTTGPIFTIQLPSYRGAEPNIEPGDTICYMQGNGLYIACSDYLDDPAGTIRMHSGNDPIPRGWKVCDGNQYVDNARYSGSDVPVSMVNKFARGTTTGTGKIGQPTRGRERLCVEDLAHHHQTGVRTPDEREVFEESPGIKVVPEDICLEVDKTFNDYIKDAEGFLAGLDFEIDANEPYIDEGCRQGTLAPACSDANKYGDINIMNPYAWIVFIERIRNYKEGAGIFA